MIYDTFSVLLQVDGMYAFALKRYANLPKSML